MGKNENFYNSFQAAVKELAALIDLAKSQIYEGDTDDAIKILNEIREELTGQIIVEGKK